MKNLTPDNMRCTFGPSCPAVYELDAEDLTPEHMRCVVAECPAVYQLPAPDTRLVIVGSDTNAIAKWLNDNKIQIGANETAVIIERELLANVLKTK